MLTKWCSDFHQHQNSGNMDTKCQWKAVVRTVWCLVNALRITCTCVINSLEIALVFNGKKKKKITSQDPCEILPSEAILGDSEQYFCLLCSVTLNFFFFNCLYHFIETNIKLVL